MKVSIDGAKYDLSKGSLFLMKTKGGETQVRQLRTDVPDAGPGLESFEAFAESDPDVRKFVDEASNPR